MASLKLSSIDSSMPLVDCRSMHGITDMSAQIMITTPTQPEDGILFQTATKLGNDACRRFVLLFCNHAALKVCMLHPALRTTDRP